MKSLIAILPTILLAAQTASAQSPSPIPTSTIMITPGCPSAPPVDVMVTRSAVAVPSCAARNETKPVIVSMSTMKGSGMSNMSATGTGMPAQFIGAARRIEGGCVMALGVVLALGL